MSVDRDESAGRTGRRRSAVAADRGGREAALLRARGADLARLAQRAPSSAWRVVVVLGIVLVPTFGSADNFRNVALAASFIAIIAVGMTFVIISGGIDLSVGSTYALAVILSAMVSPVRVAAPRSLVPLVAAAAVGLVQGLIIAWLRLPPFIVTLAGLTGIRGLVFLITHEGNDVPQVPGFKVFEIARHRLVPRHRQPGLDRASCSSRSAGGCSTAPPFGQTIQAVGGNDAGGRADGPAGQAGPPRPVYVISGAVRRRRRDPHHRAVRRRPGGADRRRVRAAGDRRRRHRRHAARPAASARWSAPRPASRCCS